MSSGSSVRVHGADLFVEAQGQGPGLVFVHAGIADSRMWDGVFERFTGTRRAVRFDVRGFGRSPLPPGRFAYHDDVAGVMDVAGVGRAVLVGCSFGALVAVETCLAHPDRVEGLVLIAPGLGEGGASEEMRRFIEDEEAALDRGDLDGATELNLRMWVDGPARAPGAVDPAVRERVRAMQRAAFEIPVPDGVERTRLDPPAGERLAEIGVPTLVVVGALDVPVMLRVAERIEREVPAARRVVVPGVAHMVSMERADEFVALLEEFITGGR
ncbi:MAG TPA: alpha/beta hydrolase [Candidatus Eisenbacteria bacterium]